MRMHLLNIVTPKSTPALLLSFALLFATAASAAGLQAYTATYDVARNGDAVGKATVTLQHTHDGWSYDSQTNGTHGMAALAAANVSEHSDVRDNLGVLETQRYRYRISTLLKTRERSINIDAASGNIIGIDKGRAQEFPMQPGVLDRQSVTLAIAQDLASGKRGLLTYNIADSKRVQAQRYQVGKEETVRVPAGAIRTINVTRLRDGDSGRTTVSWFGLDNGFVPVRIVQTEPNGDVEEMRLVSLRK